MNVDIDVAVVGAGVAGLGAAQALRAAGRSCIVLEAAGRVGGRAFTDYPVALGGVAFEQGAIWLHAAERNPLVPIARAAGDRLTEAEALRQQRTFVDGRPATADELADYARAWDRFEAAAAPLLAPDMPDGVLADVARRLPDDPWAPTVENWEGPIVAAADADLLSLRDWKQNELAGGNLLVEGGLGAFVARRLASGADVRLHTRARRIVWNGPGGRVAVDTEAGTLTAAACIVTVSTGVLAAGDLAFDPPLPAALTGAVDGLPMGLALKVVLRATGADRLGLPAHCSLDRQVARGGGAAMVFQCWPFGRDYVQGWIGGRTAWGLSRAGESAAADYALAQLRQMFGAAADGVFAGGGRLTTHWGSDPLALGAYAYARAGHAGARAALATPLADGHLAFAGEACHAGGLAGTVGGAWETGLAAAASVIAAIGE